MSLLLTLLAGWSVAAATPVVPRLTDLEAVREPRSERAEDAASLRFRKDRHQRMTVPVSLDGHGPFRFIVDTGADRTAVSSALAGTLGLKSAGRATLHSATGPVAVELAAVHRLDVGHGHVREVDAPLLEARHMGADGILGVDALRSRRVLFDFKAQTISILPSQRRLERTEKDTIVVTGKLRNGHLIVTRAWAAGQAVTVVLDTGAEISVGNAALRAALARKRRLGVPQIVTLQSVTGASLSGELHVIEDVELGGVTLQQLAVLFTDAHTFKALGLTDQPAILLGMNAMRAFDAVSIDFEARKLRLNVPEGSPVRKVFAER